MVIHILLHICLYLIAVCRYYIHKNDCMAASKGGHDKPRPCHNIFFIATIFVKTKQVLRLRINIFVKSRQSTLSEFDLKVYV